MSMALAGRTMRLASQVADDGGDDHGADVGGEGELDVPAKDGDVDVVEGGSEDGADAGGHGQQDKGVGEGVNVHPLGLGLLGGGLAVHLLNLRLIFGGGQPSADDDAPGGGAAHEGAGHQAEGGGGHCQHLGAGDAHFLHGVAIGAGGAVSAHHGDGAGAQAQPGVPLEDHGQQGADQVLENDHHDGDGQEGKHLFAALLQQAEAGGVAHAGEEQGHEVVLHVLVKGQGQHAGHVQHQVDNGEDQSAHHRGGDAAALQKVDAVGEEAAQHEQEHGDARRLVHVQGVL